MWVPDVGTFRVPSLEEQARGKRELLVDNFSLVQIFLGLIFVSIVCPRELVPYKNFCVYSIPYFTVYHTLQYTILWKEIQSGLHLDIVRRGWEWGGQG